MPTYDYKCRTCDQSATLITGINRELMIPRCVKCQTEMVRDFGSPAVKFKGKGFYSNERK
jgi:putative FmdB family regulatory protein